MILTAVQTKLASKKTLLEFKVVGSTPASAEISWWKDPEAHSEGKVSAIVPVINDGQQAFSLSYLVLSEQFWVKLDSEDRVILYENEYSGAEHLDKTLAFTQNGSYAYLYVPYCDAGSLNVELFTVDGKLLEVWNRETYSYSAKYWLWYDSTITSIYGARKLVQRMQLDLDLSVREKGSTWQTLRDVNSFYVKVSNLRPVILTDILAITLTNEADYDNTFGNTITIL